VIIVMIVLVPGLFRNLPQPARPPGDPASLSLADIPGTVRLWRQRGRVPAVDRGASASSCSACCPGIAIAVGLSILNVFRRAWAV
jgi:hypothetical protein